LIIIEYKYEKLIYKNIKKSIKSNWN